MMPMTTETFPSENQIFDAYQKRILLAREISRNQLLVAHCKQVYSKPEGVLIFIDDFGCTYDPRRINKGLNPDMPFIMFDKQLETVQWIAEGISTSEGGIIEKSRDMGASWIAVNVAVCMYLFWPGASIGFGSRKSALVDKLRDMDSLLEKCRYVIERIPAELMPIGFDRKTHLCEKRLTNPEIGSIIKGEAGDEIGRGGRSTLYFVDEAAHLANEESIDTSLRSNTECRYDISSVRGLTLFERKVKSGQYRVKIMDWRDHPGKSQEWYDKERRKAEMDGMLHKFKQEVDRDYSSVVEGMLIDSDWINAAIDAHIKLCIEKTGAKEAGLDVADEGHDNNAYVAIHGVFITRIEEWSQGDTYYTADKAAELALEDGVTEVIYDAAAVGSGVKARSRRNASSVRFTPYLGASSPSSGQYSDGILCSDMFGNLKAETWWRLRERFYKTYLAVNKGEKIAHQDLIVILSSLDNRHKLEAQLKQVTYSTNNAGKIIINKAPSGFSSPDIADALGQAFSNRGKSRSVFVRPI